MSIDDIVNPKSDTEKIVKRVCPAYTFYGAKLWGAHLFSTTDKERAIHKGYCKTHYELYLRYEAEAKKREGG